MYTHSPDPSKQYAILCKIRVSRDQAIPGYFAPPRANTLGTRLLSKGARTNRSIAFLMVARGLMPRAPIVFPLISIPN
jgi:hypothetical protein